MIRELGLELQVIFNKGAVMVLPAGVNKASGLAAALEDLGLSPHNVVAIGDAENDHALLAMAECSAAVANALPMLKARADLVTAGDHGAGVVELIERLIEDDLRDVMLRRDERQLLLGTRADGSRVRSRPRVSTCSFPGPRAAASPPSRPAARAADRSLPVLRHRPRRRLRRARRCDPFGSPQNPPEIAAIFTRSSNRRPA